MQNTLTLPALRSREFEGNPTFNVVIAYEDFETGKRAMRTYDYLVQHLGEACVFSNQMWKFEVLDVPKLRSMAAKDAAAADIIIVAAHGDSDLPPGVKAWMELWLAEGTHAIALVGLFDAEEFAENPARTFLTDAARRRKLEFFSQPGLWPGNNTAPSHVNDQEWLRNDKTFSLLANVVQDTNSISHWGINE